MWSAVLIRLEGAAEAAARQARSDIETLQAELAAEKEARPERIIERWVNQGEIDEARDRANGAYRSRDRAWSGLCALRLMHRDTLDGDCACGKKVGKCEEHAIAAQSAGLKSWENEQVERLRDRQSHHLPSQHPVLIDPRLLLTWEADW